MQAFNVVVLGAGYSGCFAAEILAGAGLRVALIKRAHPDADTASDPFDELAAPGNYPISRLTANLETLEDFSFVNASHYRDKWRVMIRKKNYAQRGLICDYLVDATGRRARLARSRGAKIIKNSRLSTVYADMAIMCPADFDMAMKRGETGIWYCSRTSQTRAEFGVMNCATKLRDHSLKDRQRWRARFHHEAQEIQSRACTPLPEKLHLRPIHEQFTNPPCGPNWAATGTAAHAFNPLSKDRRLFAEMSAHRVAELAKAEIGGSAEVSSLRQNYCDMAAGFSATEKAMRHAIN